MRSIDSFFWLDFGSHGGVIKISPNTQTPLRYKIQGGNWKIINPGESISIPSGKTYFLAAKPSTGLFKESCLENAWTISGTEVKAGGNINALLNASDPCGVTLSENAFSYLFYGCTALTQAPKLPSLKLAAGCYASMFEGCTSLVQAPDLPAVELGDSSWNVGCYSSMFKGCTSLIQAPELPSLKLRPSLNIESAILCRGRSERVTAP